MKSCFLIAGVFVFLLFLTFAVPPATAEEGAVAEATMSNEVPATEAQPEKPVENKKAKPAEAPKEKNPYHDDIMKMAKALAKDYNQDQAMALAQIRNGFGMIRAVGLVKKDVTKAVTACGRENPDMKEAITTRFDAWNGAIDSMLKKNQERMDESIHKVGFPDEKKVKKYLALVDKSAEYADSKIEKNIITTPEACGGLLESMDKTGPTMTELLDAIAWPGIVPVSAPAPENKDDAKGGGE